METKRYQVGDVVELHTSEYFENLDTTKCTMEELSFLQNGITYCTFAKMIIKNKGAAHATIKEIKQTSKQLDSFMYSFNELLDDYGDAEFFPAVIIKSLISSNYETHSVNNL